MNRDVMDLQIRLFPIESLIPYARNARTHSEEQIAQIAASIREFGWTNPILIRPDGVVIAGHARLQAARKLGCSEVPVIELSGLSEAQYRALVIADNKLALNAGWDDETLRAELAALQEEEFDMTLLGFEDEELAAALAAEDELPAHGEEDSAPDPPTIAVSAPGDLWLLGAHRLLCGDATVAKDIARLMGDEAAALVFTDPPYNVDYEGYTAERLRIAGDRLPAEQFESLLTASFSLCRTVLRTDASVYVCHASCWQREFQGALEAAGFQVRCQIIWAKNTFGWGFARYKFQHEPIFYCHIAGQSDVWYGDKSQSTLWEVDKPAANRWHPTMKPIALVDRALANSSRAGDVILDPFAGAGSTLIACERRGRKARLLEIDPKYADVIVRRWQDYTGKKATRLADGRTFEEIQNEGGRVAA